MVNISSFANSSVELFLRVWVGKDDFLVVRDELYLAIKQRFDREGIEIPFPHVSLYAGESTRPFSGIGG